MISALVGEQDVTDGERESGASRRSSRPGGEMIGPSHGQWPAHLAKLLECGGKRRFGCFAWGSYPLQERWGCAGAIAFCGTAGPAVPPYLYSKRAPLFREAAW